MGSQPVNLFTSLIQIVSSYRLARGGEIGSAPTGVDAGKDMLKMLKAVEV